MDVSVLTETVALPDARRLRLTAESPAGRRNKIVTEADRKATPRAIAPKSNPRNSDGTTSSFDPACRTMNPTSRSR